MTLISLPNGSLLRSLEPGGIAALGFFDGVHEGHRAILESAAALARGTSRPCGVWTIAYSDDPYKGSAASYLTSESDRLKYLRAAGAEFAAESDFEEIRDMNGRVFVMRVLAGEMQLSAVVCGENFRFGCGAVCGADELSEYCGDAGIDCIVVEPICDGGETVSSSRIRRLIADGDMEGAARLLGRPYSYRLPVVHGKMLGRRLGFPTANQIVPHGLAVPPPGVYAAEVTFECDGREVSLPGAANIGACPTVDAEVLREAGIPGSRIGLPGAAGVGKAVCETYIDGYSGDLYGRRIRVSLLSRLRGEMKFSGIGELRERIRRDAESAREIYEKALGERK